MTESATAVGRYLTDPYAIPLSKLFHSLTQQWLQTFWFHEWKISCNHSASQMVSLYRFYCCNSWKCWLIPPGFPHSPADLDGWAGEGCLRFMAWTQFSYWVLTEIATLTPVWCSFQTHSTFLITWFNWTHGLDGGSVTRWHHKMLQQHHVSLKDHLQALIRQKSG